MTIVCTPTNGTLVTTSMKLYKDGKTGSELVGVDPVIGMPGEITPPGAQIVIPHVIDDSYWDANPPDDGVPSTGCIWDTACNYGIIEELPNILPIDFEDAYPVHVNLVADCISYPSTQFPIGQIDVMPYHNGSFQLIDDPRQVGMTYCIATNIHTFTGYGCMLSRMGDASLDEALEMYNDINSLTLPKYLEPSLISDPHWASSSMFYRVVYYVNWDEEYGTSVDYQWGKWKAYDFSDKGKALTFYNSLIADIPVETIESWDFNGRSAIITTRVSGVNKAYVISPGETYEFTTFADAKAYYDCLTRLDRAIADRTGIYDDNPLVYRTRTLDNFASAVGDVRMYHVGKIKTIELNPMTMDNIFTYPSDSNPNDRD